MKTAALAASLLFAASGVAHADERAQTEAIGEEEEKKLVDFVGEQEPEMRKHLDIAKREHPEQYRHRLREIARMHRDPEIRERFAARAKARRKVRELAQAYRAAGEKERPAAKDKLRAAVSELFDEDVAQKELHLKKMQAEIAKLKERIAKRRSLKDKIVDRRMERLLGEEDEWDD